MSDGSFLSVLKATHSCAPLHLASLAGLAEVPCHFCCACQVFPDASLCHFLCASLYVNLWPPCFDLHRSLSCVLCPSWGAVCAQWAELTDTQTADCCLNQGSAKCLEDAWRLYLLAAPTKAIILEVDISLTSWYNLSTCNSWHGWLNHLRLNRQCCEQMVNNLQKVKLWAGLRLNFVSYLSYCHRCRLAALNHSRLYSIYKMNFKSFKSKWDKAEFLDLG